MGLSNKKAKNLKKEIESFLIATQNNFIRTKYVIAKIDRMQQKTTSTL